MNVKSVALGTIAVFVLWLALDFFIHGVLLASQYATSPGVFRPQAEIKIPQALAITLLVALFFSLLYGLNAPQGSTGKAAKFGVFYGLAVGTGMGFGTYTMQPIPFALGVGWFLGTVVEVTLAALVLEWAYRRK